MLARSVYFTGKAFGSIRESAGVSALTAATIATALLVLGGYAMGIKNLEGLALIWGKTATISVYAADGLIEKDWSSLRDRLAGIEGIEAAVLVTPKAALERFRARGPEAAALVAEVSDTVLPASVELRLAKEYNDITTVTQLAERIKSIAGVGEVDYGRDEFNELQELIALLRYAGLIVGMVVALATAFIVSNTIRLAVYARQDEIAILRLVGATSWFVRTPFIIEGAVWGLSGAMGAVGLLWLSNRFLAPRLSSAVADVLSGLPITLFSEDVAVGVLCGGFILGAAGSALAVRRFLEAEV